MKTVTAYEAKTNLARYIRHAESGEEILITRNGRPVALLSPLKNAQPDAAAFQAFRRQVRRGPGTAALRNEGRSR